MSSFQRTLLVSALLLCASEKPIAVASSADIVSVRLLLGVVVVGAVRLRVQRDERWRRSCHSHTWGLERLDESQYLTRLNMDVLM